MGAGAARVARSGSSGFTGSAYPRARRWAAIAGAITLVAIVLYLVLFLTDASKISYNALNLPVLMSCVVTGLYVWRRKLAYKG